MIFDFFHLCHSGHSAVPAKLVTITNVWGIMWLLVYLKDILHYFLLLSIEYILLVQVVLNFDLS